jgi:hypothetical protein
LHLFDPVGPIGFALLLASLVIKYSRRPSVCGKPIASL